MEINNPKIHKVLLNSEGKPRPLVRFPYIQEIITSTKIIAERKWVDI